MLGHEDWLKIAKTDLLSAKVLLKNELFSTAVYHCQQASEKSLKGYLAFQKQEILKTHDLIKLNWLCVQIDQNFNKLNEIVEQLNPFATKFRYPTEHDIPESDDVKIAIKSAQSIMRFVLKKISEPESDQLDIF